MVSELSIKRQSQINNLRAFNIFILTKSFSLLNLKLDNFEDDLSICEVGKPFRDICTIEPTKPDDLIVIDNFRNNTSV